MESDVKQVVQAVGMLLDVEASPGLSGTVLSRRWAKGLIEGEPLTVTSEHLNLDRIDQRFSLVDESSGLRVERRYSPETGHQHVVDGDVSDLPDGTPRPPVIRLLHPTELDIWGRSTDQWRIAGAEPVPGGVLIRLEHRSGPESRAEILVDASLRLPVRWTTVWSAGGVKSEIELADIELREQWAHPPWGHALRADAGVLTMSSSSHRTTRPPRRMV